jgi:hypothetical protein
MRMAAWVTVAVALAAALCFAFGQTTPDSRTQANPSAGAAQPGALIAVSPAVLDFGLVGVGRAKELALAVQNVGGGVLKGKASVAAPFNVASDSYALLSGQSAILTVRYQPTAEGTNRQSIVLPVEGYTVMVPVIGSARMPPPPPGKLRVVSKPSGHFADGETADLIVRYYSDDTSYLLKPSMMDGRFRAICDRPSVLKVARQQSGRELAAIVLTHYPNSGDEESIKVGWVNDLKGLGYQRIVFLRGRNSMDVKGLAILDGPQQSTMASEK